MKVFISWSGLQSKEVGEALRDWLPGVLQLATPYFTPSDIEKGSRWSEDISNQLTDSQVGILCVTRENIHSDWILFEAGALSKSLEKSFVCPILFGIRNADLAGPLKQFQTTEFEKGDMHKLLGVINSQIGENKLPQKTLDTVFEKWWPDLEKKIKPILDKEDVPEEPIRSDRELLEEILQLCRMTPRSSTSFGKTLAVVRNLLSGHIALHDQQANSEGDYQDTLNYLREMHESIAYISRDYAGRNKRLDELISKLQSLSYEVRPDNHDEGDNV